jgi:hypothetical protein
MELPVMARISTVVLMILPAAHPDVVVVVDVRVGGQHYPLPFVLDDVISVSLSFLGLDNFVLGLKTHDNSIVIQEKIKRKGRFAENERKQRLKVLEYIFALHWLNAFFSKIIQRLKQYVTPKQYLSDLFEFLEWNRKTVLNKT